ncbi:TonB family protein [Salipiger sp. P9]|uniref:energy transducer TonB n=1 Tax=Salipiger pentaromativorans TaxID=2943193 RepID=UPI0021573AC2|nr:TonB family protein [Salipiger pentaromativorans]MCR8546708.1 TonB family protein [Salipiger pentaromativorans]
MIANSRLLKAVALLLASSAHGALALALLPDNPPVEIEGSDGAPEARVGSSFADMATGTLSAEPSPEPVAPQPVQEAALTPLTPPEPQPPIAAEPAPRPPVPEAQSAEAPPVAEHVQPAAPAQTSAPLPAPDAVAALRPETPEAARPAVPAETLEAEEKDVPPNALARSLRPIERPETLRKPAPAPAPKAAARPKTQTKTAKAQPKAAPAPRGNADRNAKAGQEQGSQSAKATRSGAGGKAKQSGNAAASNYPGQVMRKLSRVPRPRMNVRGATVVAFRISGTGGLAGVSVARSSGSSALDSAALKVVQRAAPFPAPPAGAQRSFSVQIKGR